MQQDPTQDSTVAYLFAHFTGIEESERTRDENNEQIYFAVSRDARTWRDLRPQGRPVLKSTVGDRGMRDPYLIRDPRDGAIYMLATDLSNYTRDTAHCGQMVADEGGSTHIIVYKSRDLVHWSEPRWIDIAAPIPGASCAWAPEAAWDEDNQRFMVFWTTYTRLDRERPDASPYNMYYAVTSDFESFGRPVKWVDRPDIALDATMTRVGDWWYRAYADGRIEKTRNLYAVATEPLTRDAGPDEWSYVASISDLAGRELRCEGPEFFRFNPADVPVVSGRPMPYGFMVDGLWPDQGYRMFASADPGSPDPADWHELEDVDLGVMLKRHGSVLPITEAEYRAVTEAFAV